MNIRLASTVFALTSLLSAVPAYLSQSAAYGASLTPSPLIFDDDGSQDGISSSKFQDTDILGRREPSLSDKSVASQEVLLRMGLFDFDWSSMKSSKAVQLSNHK